MDTTVKMAKCLLTPRHPIIKRGDATLSYYDPATCEVENEVFYRANGFKLGDVISKELLWKLKTAPAVISLIRRNLIFSTQCRRKHQNYEPATNFWCRLPEKR